MDKDVMLGDVIIADEINEFLSDAKTVPTSDERGFLFEYSGKHWNLEFHLREIVNHFSTAGKSIYDAYRLSLSVIRNKLDVARTQLKLSRPEPKYWIGHIASGNIVGAAQPFAVELRGIDRKFLALEMEAAGVAKAAHDRENPVPLLVVRGASDFADERKTALDSEGKGAWRRYATASATEFLKSLLSWGPFRDYLEFVEATVKLDRRWSDYTQSEQDILVAEVKAALSDPRITVIRKRKGCVELSLRIKRTNVETFLQLVSQGHLAAFGVEDAWVSPFRDARIVAEWRNAACKRIDNLVRRISASRREAWIERAIDARSLRETFDNTPDLQAWLTALPSDSYRSMAKCWPDDLSLTEQLVQFFTNLEHFQPCWKEAARITRYLNDEAFKRGAIGWHDAIASAFAENEHVLELVDQNSAFAMWYGKLSTLITPPPIDAFIPPLGIEDLKDLRKAIDRIRKRVQRGTTAVEVWESDVGRTAPVVAAQLGDPTRERREAVADVLKQLPPQDLLVVKLRWFEGLKLREIGRILGRAKSTVSERLTSIIEALHDRLEDD